MRRFLTEIPLTANQENIVKAFIQKFLPKRGNKRKHSGNELEYVTGVVNRIMKQQFGFNLTRKNMIKCFEDLQYAIFTRNGDWDSENKKMIPCAKGNIVRMGDAYSDYDAMFNYVDVEALVVRELKLRTAKLPPNASEETKQRKSEIDAKFALFKKAVMPLFNKPGHGEEKE